MTLKEFDNLIEAAHSIRIRARELTAVANNLDEDVFNMAGIEWHSREPGFPCWTFDAKVGIHRPGYYNSPRNALEAKIKWDAEDRVV